MYPSAYLRVFQPLEAFPPEERQHWERYIVSGAPSRPARPVYREQPTVPEGRLGLLSPASGDHADVRFEDGTYYVCPWRTKIRLLASLLSLRESTPPDMVDALVTIRWFVLFDDAERRLGEDQDGYRMSYRTPAGTARQRVDEALGVIQRSELAPLVDLIGDLARWLAAFDPRSIVELDYGTVAGLFSWDELDNDHSAREVHEAVEALGAGDTNRSADIYQTVAARWAEVRSHESLN
jgi:hypothetical protein